MDLTTKLKIKELIESANIAEQLSEEDCVTVVQAVIHDYELDLGSRADWEIANEDALKLALQVVEDKTSPWPNCSNVKFPLLTVAALQCHAREYPALIFGTDLVKCRVTGEDQDGAKTARAKRVAAHMSYQLLEEDANWEDQMDRVMLTKAIVGTSFKKIYFDPVRGHNVSEWVLASDLVIPYKAKSLAKASRITQKLYLSSNDIYERVVRGIYTDAIDLKTQAISPAATPLQTLSDKVQGQHQPVGDTDEPRLILEQHRYLDLDGDGYKEPYIVTVSLQDKALLRIVARYFPDSVHTKNTPEGKTITSITPHHYYVKYGMIPSPDGGIYDLGFGSLLGPINRTCNTIINQMIDAGTLHNMGGGFLGRGARLRRGQNMFVPGEWKQCEGGGAEFKNNIVPLPVVEPSQVEFALLGMLVNYGERVAGATEALTGQNVGQNTPAQTMQEMVKQGSIIFNGIFKRTYRSLKEEFRMLYRLNQLFLPDSFDFEDLTQGTGAIVKRVDYTGKETDVRPASDPNVASVEKRLQQAIFLKQSSMSGPGYDHVAVERRLLEAAQIPYLAEVWNEKLPAMPNPKIAVEQMKLEYQQMKLKGDMQYKMLTLLQSADKIRAEVVELEARAALENAQANGVASGHAIALLQLQITAAKNKQDGMLQSAGIIKDVLDSMSKQEEAHAAVPIQAKSGGMGGVATQPRNTGGPALP